MRLELSSVKSKLKILFVYELKNLKPSIKVKIVNSLRGIGKEKGLVEENKGKWLAHQVFIVSVEKANLFERLFSNFQVKFTKYSILID